MTPDGESAASVAIGGFILQVGGASGTVIQPGAQPVAEGTGTLAQALAKPKPKEKGAPVEAAEAVEDASGVTDKCERAVSLSKGLAEGRTFEPDQLSAEVGVLLDLLEWLDRKGRHKDELKVARALATLLMLLRRWAELLRTLRTALGAAERLDDLDAIAWAKHELGTLHLAAGNVEDASRDLHEAREIRERIGDRRGLATTNRNLQVLCERLQQMVRKEELIRTRRRGPRPVVLRVLGLAVLFALAFAAGVLAGDSSNTGKQAEFTKDSGERTTSHTRGTTTKKVEPSAPTATGNPGTVTDENGVTTDRETNPTEGPTDSVTGEEGKELEAERQEALEEALKPGSEVAVPPVVK